MNKIFIAPRSGEAPSKNFKKTIENGYQYANIEQFLDEEDKKILKDYDQLYIWGNKRGTKSQWEIMSSGDYVFFYQNKKLTWVGEYLYKTHNLELADFLWERSNNKSYEYVFFLINLRKVNIDLDYIIKISNYKPNYVVQGFLKLKQEAVNNILRDFGSIEAFIDNYTSVENSNPEFSLPTSTSKRFTKENQIIQHIHKFCLSKGFQYDIKDIANFYLALKTKPLVILAGISGTGKTQLVRLFAEAIGYGDADHCMIIPVKPDWTDNGDLIGYNNLGQVFEKKKVIDIILKAKENPDEPFFIILDEMNLARVEHYFSDFLSIMETRKFDEEGDIKTDALLRDNDVGMNTPDREKLIDLGIPKNLYVVGTVNMDETTFPFSKKVLDRANSIEMNRVYLEFKPRSADVQPLNNIYNDFLECTKINSSHLTEEEITELKPVISKLSEINDCLKMADLQFAYRIRDEICFYMLNSKLVQETVAWEDALDYQIMQKVLPRIQGSSVRVNRVLVELVN